MGKKTYIIDELDIDFMMKDGRERERENKTDSKFTYSKPMRPNYT